MCVDFTNLNKACPKDCYPLLPIEQKIEAVTGYDVRSFLNLYNGYYHVMIDKDDAPKIAFITNWGIFAYKKMPFGLKNVGATYQRLVYQVFKRHIGQNVKIYVNDIIIKSSTMVDYATDL